MRLPHLQIRMEVLEQSAPDLAVMLDADEAKIFHGLVHMFRWGLGRCPDTAPPSINAVVKGPAAASLIAAAARWPKDPEAFVEACTQVSPDPLLERVQGGIRLCGLSVYDAAWGKRNAEAWKLWRAFFDGTGPDPRKPTGSAPESKQASSESAPSPELNSSEPAPKSERARSGSAPPDADADAIEAFSEPPETNLPSSSSASSGGAGGKRLRRLPVAEKRPRQRSQEAAAEKPTRVRIAKAVPYDPTAAEAPAPPPPEKPPDPDTPAPNIEGYQRVWNRLVEGTPLLPWERISPAQRKKLPGLRQTCPPAEWAATVRRLSRNRYLRGEENSKKPAIGITWVFANLAKLDDYEATMRGPEAEPEPPPASPAAAAWGAVLDALCELGRPYVASQFRNMAVALRGDELVVAASNVNFEMARDCSAALEKAAASVPGGPRVAFEREPVIRAVPS